MRELAVILHADIVGSTAMVQRHETLAHHRIRDAFQSLAGTIVAYGGTTREIRGDALLATFGRASDAVTAALFFQAANARRNAAYDDGLFPQVRIGIAIGEVVIADDTLTGPDVVTAQRIEQLAEPNGVCIQGTVCDTLPKRLPFRCVSLGEQTLKGFDDPVRVYAVALNPGEPIPEPELDTGPGASGAAADIPAPRPMLQRRVVLLALAALIAVGAIGLWAALWQTVPAPPPSTERTDAAPTTDKPSIAVLPFDDMSGGEAQDYFADGMTEDIITDLSRISGLMVIARNSSFVYKDRAVDVREVGRELGVRFVLEGSVRRSGDMLRVNAQLIDTATGGHLWADRIDGNQTDVFKLQDQLTAQIVAALEVEMTDGERHRLASAHAVDPKAYELYLRGQQLLATFRMEDRAELLKLYGHAVKLDPDFAEAHARLAYVAYDVARVDHFWVMPTAEAFALADEHARQALALDPGNATALATLAHQALERGETELAFELIEKAVAAAPGDVGILAREAYILARGGEYEAAVAAAELVLRLEPSPTAAQLMIVANTYFHARRYEEAVRYGERAREMGVRPLWALETLLPAYARLGDQAKVESARAELMKAWPMIALRYYQDFYGRSPATLEHWIESLRMAGIPEWPTGIEATAETLLTRDEFAALFSPDVQWVGVTTNGWTWHTEVDADGNRTTGIRSPQGREVAYRSSPPRMILDEGGQHVREYCTETLDNRPRERCFLLLHNAGGSQGGRDRYLSVSDRSVSRFAAVPRGESVDWRIAPR